MKSEVRLLSWWGADNDIAESAWVSTGGRLDSKRPLEDVKRVNEFMVEHNHSTPMESVWMKFYIKCPIFVERQLDKTRVSIQNQGMTIEYDTGEFGRWGITQNELSLRYRTMPNEAIDMPEDVKELLEKCGDEIETEPGVYMYGSEVAKAYQEMIDRQSAHYNAIVDFLKIAVEEKRISYQELKRVREFCRGVLGTAYMTDMQIILNLNAFEHICNQRLKPEAQLETREVVSMMLDEVEKNEVAPLTIQKMIEVNGWQRIGQTNE